MRPFNLAESKMIERRYCRQYVNKRLYCMAVLGVVVILAGVGSSVVRHSYRSKHERLKKELAGMQSISKQAERDVQVAQKISLRQAWQQQLVDGSKQCIGNLNTVLMCTPTDIWLQKVESMDRDARIAITGTAVSYAALSTFTTSLRRSPAFADVRIAGVKACEGHSAEAVLFSVELKTTSAKATASAETPSAAPSVPKIPGAM